MLCRELGGWPSRARKGWLAPPARDETERSARLFGAAEALRETLGVPQLPAERALREPYLTAAGARRDGAPWQDGRGMVFEEAVEYALAEDQPAASPPPDRRPTALTSREWEVSALVARGPHQPPDRHRALDLRAHGRHPRREILNKLGLSSRSRLAAWVTER